MNCVQDPETKQKKRENAILDSLRIGKEFIIIVIEKRNLDTLWCFDSIDFRGGGNQVDVFLFFFIILIVFSFRKQ